MNASDAIAQLDSLDTLLPRGRIVRAAGVTLHAAGLRLRIGQRCRVLGADGAPALLAEVIGFDQACAVLAPFGSLADVGPLSLVEPLEAADAIACGPGLLGRTLDANGSPLDALGPLAGPLQPQPLRAAPPSPLERPIIRAPLPTGVKAIDAFTPIGRGQRLGIFAAAGVGKSTLLGMIARGCESDVNVVALIGERGREVAEFLEEALGPGGLARSVVVAATSDRPAAERVRAGFAATAIAEHFAAAGANVLLLLDSVTRFARALREMGLAAGEPPVRRGFPPSVFATLPQLFERAGARRQGAITALYTVLVEDEEESDPIAEEVRSLLDGHLILSRRLAQAGRFPAVDVAASVSRLFERIAEPRQKQAVRRLRAAMARYAEVELLLKLGEHRRGADPELDAAIDLAPAIQAFLQQDVAEVAPWDRCLAALGELA